MLVAGEIGVSIGTVYTSYSGFKTADSAGTVQCIALGKLLQSHGFQFWDLGMGMAYKYKFGSVDKPRLQFMAKLRKSRDDPTPLLTIKSFPVLQLFPTSRTDSSTSSAPSLPFAVASKVLPQRDHNSKRQRKFRAKRERIAQYKLAKRASKGNIVSTDSQQGSEGIETIGEAVSAQFDLELSTQPLSESVAN